MKHKSTRIVHSLKGVVIAFCLMLLSTISFANTSTADTANPYEFDINLTNSYVGHAFKVSYRIGAQENNCKDFREIKPSSGYFKPGGVLDFSWIVYGNNTNETCQFDLHLTDITTGKVDTLSIYSKVYWKKPFHNHPSPEFINFKYHPQDNSTFLGEYSSFPAHVSEYTGDIRP